MAKAIKAVCSDANSGAYSLSGRALERKGRGKCDRRQQLAGGILVEVQLALLLGLESAALRAVDLAGAAPQIAIDTSLPSLVPIARRDVLA